METMDKTNLNIINWLLYASENLFTLWKKMCDKWLSGELPGPDGLESDKPRAITLISANLFQQFEGLSSEAVIIGILNKVLAKKCLLKKDAAYKGSFPSLEELGKLGKIME
jgi:hypothetical protein